MQYIDLAIGKAATVLMNLYDRKAVTASVQFMFRL